jgi:uncharacterized damage-inducible protein DinB
MNELELILGRLKQTFEKSSYYGFSISEGSWHGPTLLESLEGVDSIQARAKPIERRHTIWEIVNHCAYWMNAVISTLKGEKMVNVSGTEDWPEIGKSSNDWDRDIHKLKETHKELVKAIKTLVDSDLEKKIGSYFGDNYFEFTYRKMLHGISDHNTYHAGQISLLKN